MLERAAAAGRNVGLLAERPELDAYQSFVWKAFNDLHSCRALGLAPGPIPWTAISHWAREHGVVDPDDFEDLAYLVAELDAAWLAHESQAAEKKNKKGR